MQSHRYTLSTLLLMGLHTKTTAMEIGLPPEIQERVDAYNQQRAQTFEYFMGIPPAVVMSNLMPQLLPRNRMRLVAAFLFGSKRYGKHKAELKKIYTHARKHIEAWNPSLQRIYTEISHRQRHIYAQKGFSWSKTTDYCLVEIVRCVAAGADPDFAARTSGYSPLVLAVMNYRIPIALELIQAGANLNQCASNEWTALQHALYTNGGKHLIRILLNAGADPNLNCALHFTIWHKPSCIPLLLAKGADPWKKNHSGKTAFEVEDACKLHLIDRT